MVIYLFQNNIIMEANAVNELTKLKNDINTLIESRGEKIMDSTESVELQNDLQRNVIDFMNETIEQIDLLLENITNGDYDNFIDEPDDDSSF